MGILEPRQQTPPVEIESFSIGRLTLSKSRDAGPFDRDPRGRRCGPSPDWPIEKYGAHVETIVRWSGVGICRVLGALD
jgi:hypothetical protein